MHLYDILNWCAKFIREEICKLGTSEYQINVSPCGLLIFEFFANPTAMLMWTTHLFIIPNIFLLTYTEIDDVSKNILIS